MESEINIDKQCAKKLATYNAMVAGIMLLTCLGNELAILSFPFRILLYNEVETILFSLDYPLLILNSFYTGLRLGEGSKNCFFLLLFPFTSKDRFLADAGATEFKFPVEVDSIFCACGWFSVDNEALVFPNEPGIKDSLTTT